MTQTPNPPAGWYPQGDQERWWDGTAWSDNFRPLGSEQTPPGYTPVGYQQAAYQQPVPYGQPAYGTPTYGAPQQPVQKSNFARNCLIVFAVLFVLFVGGCVALVAVVGNEVNDTLNDDTPGGPNNPLTIVEGQGFEVDGFEYAAGWDIADATVTGLFQVDGLKVTNNRGKADRLNVQISLLQDGEVLATTFCLAGQGLDKIPQDTTVPVECSSGDDLPPAYDEITIKDVL